MKNAHQLERKCKLFQHLQYLPKKIVDLHNDPRHEHDDLAEFVLHELCHQGCFDISKAAYFINNPDFHCLKGVVGIHKKEPNFCNISDIWQDPNVYATYMRSSPFNQKVRAINKCDVNGMNESDIVHKLAQELELQHPECVQWHMKHGNDGVLIFEHQDVTQDLIQEHLAQMLYLLSFCPIH